MISTGVECILESVFCWMSLCYMLSKTYLLEKRLGALKVWFC